MLEPYARKPACPVLRGREASNGLLLPDQQTPAAMLVSREFKAPGAAAAAELYRYGHTPPGYRGSDPRTRVSQLRTPAIKSSIAVLSPRHNLRASVPSTSASRIRR